jgi:alpha-L-rhamnosidase
MAAVLGHNGEVKVYSELFEAIKAAFNREFVTFDGRITGDTQAGYALALNFNLLPDDLRPMTVRRMVERIAAYHDHISTGIQTTHRMMLELTRNGFNDVAYRLINTRTFPSWGYSIDNGATTVWERWDGYVKGRGFQDPGMNSFNHWALGSVGEWMIRVIGGISPDEAYPAFTHFVLRPYPGGGLTHATAEYRSIRGRIGCRWNVEEQTLSIEVIIPPNTTATVYLPTSDIEQITEGGRPVEQAKGARFLRVEDGATVFEVESGRYQFETRVVEENKSDRKTGRKDILIIDCY